MRKRELDALAASNPLGRERVEAMRLGADRGALLDAVADERVAPGQPPAGPRRRGVPLPLLVALVAAVLAGAGAFTTPGRAVTGWVGERLGLGEPGGPPSLRQLNESWAAGTSLEGRPQRVLVVGPVGRRERSRYEFIAYWPRRDRPSWPQGPCFKLDLVQERSMTGQGCGTLPAGGQFAYAGVGGGYGSAVRRGDELRFEGELLHVTGRVGPRVASVEARVDGREIPVQLRPVPRALRERFGLGGPFAFFVAFFSGVPRGGSLEVTARGADGERLGHARTELVDQALAAELRCRAMLSGPRPAPRPGREECRDVLGSADG